jgi:hypothetical protein
VSLRANQLIWINDRLSQTATIQGFGRRNRNQVLTGLSKEICQLWAKYFRARGYKLRVEIVDFPGGMPGDVGMTLKWD